jgi:hypothetical protein
MNSSVMLLPLGPVLVTCVAESRDCPRGQVILLIYWRIYALGHNNSVALKIRYCVQGPLEQDRPRLKRPGTAVLNGDAILATLVCVSGCLTIKARRRHGG